MYPQELFKRQSEFWRPYADQAMDKLLEIMSDPNVEALGDAMDQAGRGMEQLPSPWAKGVGMGMVWGGKALGRVDAKQLNTFLNYLGDLAQGTKKSGWANAADMLPEERMAKTYFEGRRTPAVKNLHPYQGTVPDPLPGQYGEFKMDPRAGQPGSRRGIASFTGEGTMQGPRNTLDPLTERIMAMSHEAAGHGAEHAQKSRKYGHDWVKPQFEVPYFARPTEQRARRAEAAGKDDFERFLDAIGTPEVRDQLDPRAQKVADSFLQARQAAGHEQLVGQLPGYSKETADELMSEAWNMLNPASPGSGGAPPVGVQRPGMAGAMEGRVPAGFTHGTGGSIVRPDGQVIKVKPEDVHAFVKEDMGFAPNAVIGIETRGNGVRIKDPQFLQKDRRNALEKAVSQAFKDDPKARNLMVSVEVPGAGIQNMQWAAVSRDDVPLFLDNPQRYLRDKMLEQGLAGKRATFGRGRFVDIRGKVTKMRENELHLDLVNKLKKKKQEFRGFEVREGSVRTQDPDFLVHKDGLREALDQAFQLNIVRYGKPADVIVEVPGSGWAAIKLEEIDSFVKNPMKHFKMQEFFGGQNPGTFKRL
jgi:hypothetical protein